MSKTYVIYCEPCGFKKIIENPLDVGLTKYPASNIQGRIPVLNPENRKTETFEFIQPMPKFKCPNCGRTVILKKFNVPLNKPNDPIN